MADIDPKQQDPDPWVGKTQTHRLENILFTGPAMIYFGWKGLVGRLARTYALLGGPGIILNNLRNYWRLEQHRWESGRPDYWWNDPQAREAQFYRIVDMAILGPAAVYTAIYPRRMNRPEVRKLALVLGAMTVIYNWRNYFTYTALERKVEEAKMALVKVGVISGG